MLYFARYNETLCFIYQIRVFFGLYAVSKGREKQ